MTGGCGSRSTTCGAWSRPPARAAAGWSWADTRSVARSRRRTPPGTSRASPGRRASGLVYIDGGSSRTPITRDEAEQELQDLQAGSPWLAFGGIAAPFAGLFATGGAGAAIIKPNGPSLGQSFPLVPANLKPPVPATNLAQWGYASDTETSPPNLAAFQAHVGRLAASGNPQAGCRRGRSPRSSATRGCSSGPALHDVDGVAWYHPLRLTIDAGAVAAGNQNPAFQNVLSRPGQGMATTSRSRSTRSPPPGGAQRVLDAARALAQQSNLPPGKLTLVNRQGDRRANDPAGAYPEQRLPRPPGAVPAGISVTP